MARTAVSGRLATRLRWQAAALIERREESPTAQTLAFDLPGWAGHLPGQHVDVRLTAEDGYSTQRSYSIASAPDADRVELTVQRVPDGEVSPYLADDLMVGDAVEIRGPVGGWFVWRPEQLEPVLLIAGGSGVVPLMSMIRVRGMIGSRVPFRLLYSVRDPADRLYGPELDRGAPGLDTTWVYTRGTPDDWARPAGRLTPDDLVRWGWPADFEPTCYVCGPTGFVEAAAGMLVALGHHPDRIRTERFGPSGG
ncbi:ferredoxin reductase [Streptomyces cocklensis]|jgi:ferredoxin-NADP reductase|uniref:Flavodoxin reductases (Ferredoxin-NADPH reductases) family 1 n=1 Tax=Actinacidiphila cocklensis TaxID=887465 RepID=A0A9W4DUU4_9ACTN|nr:ferredoxin reductase [Actinacidiphila cocklensis]MDD1063501.1 ferredoxin reductase [Actinacidiphila cocklensis]WSX75638.1 ferredoxin reductase [Streptomyces sp. NBC_00899]CAG6398100.1 Flavodoxin reductases (ferredoxin-NADPH reductases) family 1 [Actinacidiphila cocklensis]